MHCEVATDAGAFLSRAGEHLESRPVEHNLLLTLAHRYARAGAGPDRPLYLVVTDRGAAVGAAMWTPPYLPLVSFMPPEAAEAVAHRLIDLGGEDAGTGAARRPDLPELPGVTGPAEVTAAFAAHWERAPGSACDPDMAQRLYRLDRPPGRPAVPGRVRAATPADRELLIAWTAAFIAESGVTGGDPGRIVDQRLGSGLLWLWDDDGPACYLGTNVPTLGVVRVGPVYTPSERRRRGYGGAAVAAVSRDAFAAGATCCVLYADVANATSTGVYLRLGFRPVLDVQDFLASS